MLNLIDDIRRFVSFVKRHLTLRLEHSVQLDESDASHCPKSAKKELDIRRLGGPVPSLSFLDMHRSLDLSASVYKPSFVADVADPRVPCEHYSLGALESVHLVDVNSVALRTCPPRYLRTDVEKLNSEAHLFLVEVVEDCKAD